MKLNQKLLLIFLEIALIPLILLGFVAYSNTQKEITREVILKLETLADIQKNRFENRNHENLERLNLLTSRLQLRLETAAYEKKPNVSSKEKIRSILNDAIKGISSFQEISVVGINGQTIASTNNEAYGKNISQEEYYRLGRTDNQITYFALDKQGLPHLYLSGPLVLDGRVIGVLVVVSDGSNIFTVVSNYTGLGKTGETLLARKDSHGNAVFLTPTRFDQHAALKSVIPKNALNLPIITAINGNEKIFTDAVDYRGNRVLAVTRYMPREQWGIVAEISKYEAYAPIEKLGNLLIFISAVSSLIMIGISFSISKSFTKPIQTLTQAAHEIASGNLAQRINISSTDELGILARTFNDMTAKLQSSYEELEHNVHERTTELALKINELEDTKKATLNILEDLQEAKGKIVQEKAKDEAILTSAGEGILVTDKVGRILFTNKAASEILSIPKDALVGKLVTDAYAVYDEFERLIPKEKRAIMSTYETGQKIAHTSIYKKPSGEKLYIYVTATPVLQGTAITGAIQIIRDVTHEKDVDRMKTEFISLASHQLRTPLSAIKWFTEMLVNGDIGKLTREQEDFAKNISESTERMIQLVNSLLNISRIESGRIMIEPQPTDIVEMIKSLKNELTAKIDEKKQHVILSTPGPLPVIDVDPHLIRQVYLNLLTNAIKYTPEGGEITVFISIKDDEIVTQITDNGYGIPASQQNKVFQKFFRAENILKIETDGTGLGLYLVRSVVEASGGKIWFKSEEGYGSSFWVSLPLAGSQAKKGEVSLD